jgi:hypothetical protein
MSLLGIDARRAVPLAFVFAAMACGGSIGGGAGGCGPSLDADKIAADAKGSNAAASAAAARAKMGDALIQKGEGYEKNGFADSLSGFSGDGSTLPGSPKSEFARLAQSLPPTPENQKLIEQALGQDNARHGQGGSTDLAGNGGYVSVVDGADGKPKWQWNAYDGKHSAPKGFEKPYVPPPGYKGEPSPATGSASAAGAGGTDPLAPPPGTTGCWPKPPGLHHINLHLMGGNKNRRVVDSTPIVCSGSYCSAVGFNGRGCCPLRPEGDPMRVTCEGEVLGRNAEGKIGPRWVYKGNGGVEVQPVNPFLAWAYGNGWVGACSNISPVCSWKEVINHPEELAGGTTSQALGGGGGGGSGGSSPSRSSSAPKSSSTGTPLKASTDTAPGNSNLESLVPTIPEVEPATNTPPN